MATIGHVAVGLAAARLSHNPRVSRWAAFTGWSALSLLPDADLIGFALGVPYSHPWGHRGATHSLTFALVVGVTSALATRQLTHSTAKTAILASAVLASHPLLDALTYGGLGCALLWPFDLTRYLSPLQPIPAAPFGLAFLSSRGLFITAMETLLFSPLLIYALRSSKRVRRPVLGIRNGLYVTVWLLSAWLLTSSDRFRDAMIGFMFREDTAFASGFSEETFRTIRPGQTEQVLRRLGLPVAEDWRYPPLDGPGCRALRLVSQRVVAAWEQSACNQVGVTAGTPRTEAMQHLGAPPEFCAEYTWSPSDGHYRVRVVCVAEGKVAVVVRRWR